MFKPSEIETNISSSSDDDNGDGDDGGMTNKYASDAM